MQRLPPWFHEMTEDERFRFLARGQRVRTYRVEQIDPVQKKIVARYGAQIRGIPVSDGDRRLFATKEEALEFGHEILKEWKAELAALEAPKE